MPGRDIARKLAGTVLEYIHKHQLVPAQETVVVGVSGGPDSVCLLHLLWTLRENLQLRLHVAHLDHMMRGIESETDAAYVEDLAGQLGLPVTIERQDVDGYRKANRLTVEEAARDVRYEFLGRVAAGVGSSTVAVGHILQDQAETILMRFLRGAGALGLQGIQPAMVRRCEGRDVKVIRPLLEISRRDVERYNRSQGLIPREDPSNVSHSFLRNRVRHHLIPVLHEYNPRIEQALLRTAEALTADSAFLDEQASQLWETLVSLEEGTVSLSMDIRRLHVALQRRLLREAVKTILGDIQDVEWKHIEKMRSAFALPKGKRISLPRGLVFQVLSDGYRLTSVTGQDPTPRYPSSA